MALEQFGTDFQFHFIAVACALINVQPKGVEETTAICGVFDFSEEFLIKIPITGSKKCVKSNQISLTWCSVMACCPAGIL